MLLNNFPYSIDFLQAHRSTDMHTDVFSALHNFEFKFMNEASHSELTENLAL